MATKPKPHVGVIGAGLSGLRCADILLQNGAQVTILEARDRIGGRVHQEELDGRSVDLGPNWIHGAGANPIMSIAQATQTDIYDPEGRNLIFSRDGSRLSEEVARQVEEFVWTTISEAFEYSSQQGDLIPADRSLYDFFQEKVQQTAFSAEVQQYCLHACRLWGAYVGDGAERQSLRFFRLEECVDGSNYVVASTYSRILQHVSKTVLEYADIRLNQPVVNINAPHRDDQHPQQVTVTIASGETYSFDEVVVTCPLGWLKRNTDAFHPPLPVRLLDAIDNVSYGRLEKVYVSFPRAFWHSDSASSTPLSSAQFLEPDYAPHPPDIQWNQECLSLAALPPPHAHPTLLFYTYGSCGSHIVHSIANLSPTDPRYAALLTSLLHPFYSRLPGYDPADPACIPSAILATRWQLDPYAGYGSYCNFQVGLSHGDADVETLRDGAGAGPARGLWFAGEHTAPFVALGTTTGAYWSGERIAARVCRRWGLGEVGVGAGPDDSLPSAGRR
ncbi:hypothetical protein N7462_009828 [Penicillium macrosclerotiorum]|uniref:uncharacterized protein n=1 Tax=Penicillium macrosclerotiorum TaxID=303699 RepID=UPI002547958D|nr:uncharacterized protein N7462_009828 [Penicillium macrosclerotiorum]KAJ5668758.1 hypothetical protein N7462_009828 [Penicillium macrosclerotiorum]